MIGCRGDYPAGRNREYRLGDGPAPIRPQRHVCATSATGKSVAF